MGQRKLTQAWSAIKNRCYKKSCKEFKYYGGKGVKLYAKWLTNSSGFIAHLSTLENYAEYLKPNSRFTIDRINGSKGYVPGNIRIVDKTIQARNRIKKENSLSKYIGVSQDKLYTSNRNWNARITIDKRTLRIGRFLSEVEAAKARDAFIKDNNLKGFKLNFN